MESRNQIKSLRIKLQGIRFERTSQILAAIAAALGIIAGVLGLMAANLDRDNASLTSDRAALISAKEELELQLITANAEVSARDDTITALRDENEALRAAAPYTVDPQDVHKIRATHTVTLAKNGDTIDLNSVMPNFGAGGTTASSDTAQYDGDELRLHYDVSSLTLGSGVAKYETCAAETGYSRTSSIDIHLLEDPTVCLRLQSGRYVALQVVHYDETEAEVTFTVWE